LVEPTRGVVKATPHLAPVVRPASLNASPADSETIGVPAVSEAVVAPVGVVATPAVASAPDGANLAALFSAPAPAPARPEAGSATPPETAQAAASEHRYGVHLASFRERWRAEALAAEYGRKGVETMIYAYEVPGKGTWQRIAAGPFADFDQAGAAAARLRADLNLDYARVVRLPGGPAASAGEDGR
jgi:cell division septation protein DedD